MQRAEAELRKRRDANETDVLQEAARTQTNNLNWINECGQEIKEQDYTISTMTKTLKDTMEKRQRNNVQKLLQAIEHDQASNIAEIREMQEQMETLNGDY